jgi:hypothetical protein
MMLDNILSLGYSPYMSKVSEAARALAKCSIEARRLKWGRVGFRKKMQAWGKLGGRPPKKEGKR